MTKATSQVEYVLFDMDGTRIVYKDIHNDLTFCLGLMIDSEKIYTIATS